ncbi:hypothetical protein [Bacillus sp. EB01]|uniref:hypothetical protein n=1 Tax=Bacillus sp. EB01 TaxID=1347086 RepID=UPI0005C64FEB|nr:hypothetical protein [Bacillus sp. EB01]
MKPLDIDLARKELNSRVPFTPRQKAKILNDLNRNPRRKEKTLKPNLSINWFTHSIVVMATILLVGIISTSYFFQQKESNTAAPKSSGFEEQINKNGDVLTKNDDPVTETPAPSEGYTYDINELLTKNPYYHKLYQTLAKAINSEEGAGVYILYLHALKQGDIGEVKKHSFATRESEIEALIEHYNKINYETITIDKTIPSKAEPSFEVHLTYQLSRSNNKKKKTIHIHMNDGVTINISEPEL